MALMETRLMILFARRLPLRRQHCSLAQLSQADCVRCVPLELIEMTIAATAQRWIRLMIFFVLRLPVRCQHCSLAQLIFFVLRLPLRCQHCSMLLIAMMTAAVQFRPHSGWLVSMWTTQQPNRPTETQRMGNRSCRQGGSGSPLLGPNLVE